MYPEKVYLYDFPIILLLDKNSSQLAGRIYELKINDFLFELFDISALLSKIQILDEYKKLYLEKQQLLKSEHEKSVLLYSVTHNVNIPLTILLNDIQKCTCEEFYNQSDELKNISESAREISLIIQNALNSYKISDGGYISLKKIVNLKEILENENSFLFRKGELKNQQFNFIFHSKSGDCNSF